MLYGCVGGCYYCDLHHDCSTQPGCNLIFVQALVAGVMTHLPVSEIYVKVSVLEFSRFSVRGTESPQTQNSKLLNPYTRLYSRDPK